MPHHRSYPVVHCEHGQIEQRPLLVRGREGMTLLKLVQAGECGITAYDFEGGPPFRLAAYVHDLREMGLQVRTEREEHPGGWHARYVLETPIQIRSIQHGPHTGNRGCGS